MERVLSTITIAQKRINPQRVPERRPPTVASLRPLIEKARAEAKNGDAVIRKMAPRTGRNTRGMVTSMSRRALPTLLSRSAVST